jgi:2-amino-4-hydroxy-6-hydroxymethyldihydropteridine diphosphokinase
MNNQNKNVVFALGSNVGNPLENIIKSIDLLKEQCNWISTSAIYKTPPVDYLNQDPFLNCVCEFQVSNCDPFQLESLILQIQAQFPWKKTIYKGPRMIDLDIIFIDDEQHQIPLIIPHPRWFLRPFVYHLVTQLPFHKKFPQFFLPYMFDPNSCSSYNLIRQQE